MCGYVLKDEDSRMTGLIEVVQKGILFQRQKATSNKEIMTTKRR